MTSPIPESGSADPVKIFTASPALGEVKQAACLGGPLPECETTLGRSLQNRVAINGRTAERRHVNIRGDVLGKASPERLAQRHADRCQWLRLAIDQRPKISDT